MTHPLAQAILNARGEVTGACPTCGAAKKQRTANASFGRQRFAICGQCGHEFRDEPPPVGESGDREDR